MEGGSGESAKAGHESVKGFVAVNVAADVDDV